MKVQPASSLLPVRRAPRPAATESLPENPQDLAEISAAPARGRIAALFSGFLALGVVAGMLVGCPPQAAALTASQVGSEMMQRGEIVRAQLGTETNPATALRRSGLDPQKLSEFAHSHSKARVIFADYFQDQHPPEVTSLGLPRIPITAIPCSRRSWTSSVSYRPTNWRTS